MNSPYLEDFETDLYEEFNNQEDEKISNIYSKYLKIIDDNEDLTKSDKKVMFANQDDNEYEPIDRTVGDMFVGGSFNSNSKCMFQLSVSANSKFQVLLHK